MRDRSALQVRYGSYKRKTEENGTAKGKQGEIKMEDDEQYGGERERGKVQQREEGGEGEKERRRDKREDDVQDGGERERGIIGRRENGEGGEIQAQIMRGGGLHTKVVLSPGMTISLPSGRYTVHVMSAVRKNICGR